MLSKVVRGDKARTAEAIPWRTLPRGLNMTSRPGSVCITAPGSQSDAGGRKGDPNEIAALKAKISELESELQRQVRETGDRAFKEGHARAKTEADAEQKAVLLR